MDAVVLDRAKGSIECPQCGSDDYSTTLMGYPTGRNANRVICLSCGWHGTAEDWITIKRLRGYFRLASPEPHNGPRSLQNQEDSPSIGQKEIGP